MPRPVYQIDGKDISTTRDFFARIWPLLAGSPFTGTINLDAFNDILSWPDEPYVLVWKNSDLSRQRLGHGELAKKLSQMLEGCHPSNNPDLRQRLNRAESGEGPTMFDWLVEIIRDKQNAKYVTLQLE